MNQSYELRVSENLKRAWEIFLKGPEIFIVTQLAYIGAIFVLGSIPLIGPVISLAVTALVVPIALLMAEQTVREGKPSFSCLQKVGNLWPQLIVLSLASMVLYFISFCLFIIPFFYLYTAYFYAVPYVVFENKNFWEALEASRHLVNKKFWGVQGLIMVVLLLHLCGLLMLGIGFLFTAPIASILIYTTWEDIRSQTGHPKVVHPEVVT